jgi:hypothetical protein
MKPLYRRRLPVSTAERRRVNGSSRKSCTETGRICRNLAKHGLELGKELLDRIQVRAVCWKVEQKCTSGFDRLFSTFDHVNARIIHEYDIVLLQSPSEELFDIGLKQAARDMVNLIGKRSKLS